MYLVKFSKQAEKDKQRLKAAGLERRARELLDLKGNYSRRINIQHRLVYSVLPNIAGYDDLSGHPADGIVLIKRMWTHYA